MLDFGDIKSIAFKEDSISNQVLYMFQDALRMIYRQFPTDSKRRVVPQTCDLSSDSFKIILHVYELSDISFPVFWFASQSAAYRSVRSDSRSRIDVEFVKDNPSYAEVVYRLWIDLPF